MNVNSGKEDTQEVGYIRPIVSLIVGGDGFAIDISVLRDPGGVVRMNGKQQGAGFPEGILDLDGHEVPVVDMRRDWKTNMNTSHPETILVVIDSGHKTFGFLMTAGRKAIQALPKGEKRPFSENDRLFVGAGEKQHILKINDILCIKAEGEYSTIILSPGSKFFVRKLMKEWENQLPGSIFLRIHRSTIVNINHVERIEKWSKRSHIVYLKNLQEPLVISQRYFSEIKSRFLI